jgi:hypothetical protein
MSDEEGRGRVQGGQNISLQIWIALGVGFQMLLRKLNRVSSCFLVSLNVSCGCRLRAPIAIPARGSRPRSQCGERQDSAGSRATQLQGEQARATRSCAVCGACPPPLRTASAEGVSML